MLSHVFPDNSERPIACASRTLSKTERGYSQLDREALALVFGVKLFHQYVYGRDFELYTDHRPLTYIFGSKRGIPHMTAARVQRWAVFLTAYDFTIKHIEGAKNVVADSLSRNLVVNFKEENESESCSHLNFISEAINCVTGDDIPRETLSDPILKDVYVYVCHGWPNSVKDDIIVYKNRENELYVENGCIMWGHRIIVPFVLRKQILNELHSAHLGIGKMKALARAYVWWPKIDSDIERMTKTCNLCVANGDNPPRSKLHVREWTKGPNQRVHVDFCDPIVGSMYFVMIDAFSKWIHVKEMQNITAVSTIKACREYFGIWGLPETLVSDNGPTFTSELFQKYLAKYNIKLTRSTA